MTKTFFQRLNSPTPEFWGKVRNVCVAAAAAIGAGWAAIANMQGVPEEWGKVVALVIGICTVVAAYSQQKDNEEE